jgi:vacuolar protein sorting-associated protein 54
MELLVKETVTLHKVLSRYLSAPIVEVGRLNSLLLLLLTVCFVVCDVTSLCRHQSPPLRRIRADRVTEPGGQGQACDICRTLYQNATSDYSKRMLADARFLHQKLSVLKNISAPTNMVETVVAEKSIPRKSTLGNFRTTVGPNERLRGLLSRRDSTKPDKPLPSPTQSAQTAPSNGGAADEFVAESDRVIPPPRISSRSSGAVPTRAETRTSVEGNGVLGNSALQSEEELLENSNPILSSSSLLGALREPSDGNDDDQLAALTS